MTSEQAKDEDDGELLFVNPNHGTSSWKPFHEDDEEEDQQSGEEEEEPGEEQEEDLRIGAQQLEKLSLS